MSTIDMEALLHAGYLLASRVNRGDADVVGLLCKEIKRLMAAVEMLEGTCHRYADVVESLHAGLDCFPRRIPEVDV